MTDETFEAIKKVIEYTEDKDKDKDVVYNIQMPLAIVICGLTHEFICEVEFTFDEADDLLRYKTVIGIDTMGNMFDFTYMISFEHQSGATMESIILNNHANWGKPYSDGGWK